MEASVLNKLTSTPRVNLSVYVYSKRRLCSLASLALCIALSTLLVLQRFGVIQLWGCRNDSTCARTISDTWSNFYDWPVAFVGLAYFAAVGAGWIAVAMNGNGIPTTQRFLIRLGAMVSAFYLALLLGSNHDCSYCVAMHLIHFGFCFFARQEPVAKSGNRIAMVTAAATFALVSSLLMVGVSEQQRRIREFSSRDPHKLESQSVATLHEPHDVTSATASFATKERIAASPVSDLTDELVLTADNDIRAPHRRGRKQAAIQIIMFFDYQSRRSRQIDSHLRTLAEKYEDDISVIYRHYPLCADCNFSLQSTSHPNACRAARAAEAAKTLQGDDGFWRIHRWLFQREGSFTDDELRIAVTELGFEDWKLFASTMQSKTTLSAILADVVEAQALSVVDAPTVFVNDRKVYGRLTKNAIVKAVGTVADQAVEEPVTHSEWENALADGFPSQLQMAALATTVRIVNSRQSLSGTGVIVGVRPPFAYVLSANHVVSTAKTVQVHTFTQQSYPDPENVYSRATVIAKSADADLTLLRFSTRDSLPEPLPMLPRGYADKNPFMVFSIGCNEGNAPTCLVDRVLGKQRVRREAGSAAIAMWTLEGQSVDGRSGGPVIIEPGLIIGISSGMSAANTHVCHSDEIHRFLKENGLSAVKQSNRTINRGR